MPSTWKPHEKHGELTAKSDLPDSVFAFPKQRKEPMTDASHVRNAIARFDQTTGVEDFGPRSGLRQYQGGGQALRRRHERDGLAGAREGASHGSHGRRSQEIGAEGGDDAQDQRLERARARRTLLGSARD